MSIFAEHGRFDFPFERVGEFYSEPRLVRSIESESPRGFVRTAQIAHYGTNLVHDHK